MGYEKFQRPILSQHGGDIRDATLLRPELQSPTLEGVAVAAPVDPTLGTGVTAAREAKVPVKVTLTLTNVLISIAAAQDYGSVKLLDDIGVSGYAILSASLSLTLARSNVADIFDDVQMALGSSAMASTSFAAPGDADIAGPFACSEGFPSGNGNLVANAGPSASNYPTGNGELYLNAEAAVTTGTGTITVNGTVVVVLVPN